MNARSVELMAILAELLADLAEDRTPEAEAWRMRVILPLLEYRVRKTTKELIGALEGENVSAAAVRLARERYGIR